MRATGLGRLFLAAVLVAGAGVAGAAIPETAKAPQTLTLSQSDADLARRVTHEIRMYPYYSIWDDLSFRVANGQVELLGAVNQPFKKSDIERIVRRVPGVAGVTDQIRVLPLSPNDDRLRLQVARAIYGDPAFTRYAMMALPPVHILVENGHVTLDGVVSNTFEKQIAGIRASSAGLSFGEVVNNLQVENAPAKKS